MSLLEHLQLGNEAGNLVVSLGVVRMHELPTRPNTKHSRSIYVDNERTIAAKVEHSYSPWKREPYQCWNEYTLWDEHLSHSTLAQEWIAPTLEMNVHPCPVHDTCVVSVCVQEYIDDGWPVTADLKRAQAGDMDHVFKEFPMLVPDVAGPRLAQQTVFSEERGHLVLVDYGYNSVAGIRVPSRSRPDGFWAWVRRVIMRVPQDSF